MTSDNPVWIDNTLIIILRLISIELWWFGFMVNQRSCRTIVVLFNPYLERLGTCTFLKGISNKSKRYNATRDRIYDDVAVRHLNYYAMVIPTTILELSVKNIWIKVI